MLGVGQLVAGPVARALGGGGAVAEAAVSWLRIALCGAPLVLVTLAGNGWMRGVQDTARPLRYVLAGNGLSAVLCPLLVHAAGLGLPGSAVANVAGQVVGAGLFLARCAASDGARGRAGRAAARAGAAARAAGLGRDLLTRSLAFQACFLSAAAVAARFGAPVAAHQIVLQLWFFMALVLDAVAIAAQSLVGAALGAGDVRRARGLARQVGGYGLVLGTAFGVLFAALAGVLPRRSPPIPRSSRPCPRPGGSSPVCSRWRASSSPSTACCSAPVTPPTCAPGPWSPPRPGSCR